MSALAAALVDLGARVSGSDIEESDATNALRDRGVAISIGHAAINLGDAARVVYTGALAPDNAELFEAERRGIPVIKRAQLLGELMDLRRGVAVAGTHGKTTTSAMVAWVLAAAGRDPSYMIGGTIRGLGKGGHWGSGNELVAEADEYDRSFLNLRPQVGIITNIEGDHLEYYGSMDAIIEAFKGFACNVRDGGVLFLCAEDPEAIRLHDTLLDEKASFRTQTYGYGESALWRAVGVKPNARGGSDYTAVYDEEEVARVSLAVPGAHNALNSLAALAACVELGVDVEEVARHLGEFAGAGRRFEIKGGVRDITVVDDYAHHPTEIAATLRAARQRFPAYALVVVFQPHTYTRTRDFLDDFARSLGEADHVILTEIYASRERDTLGMSGKMIVERIANAPAEFAPTLEDAVEAALAVLQIEGSVLLTLGAGDVWKVGDEVLRRLGKARK
jgi:UDP-N-acetylmuramate--alanine ligase